MIALIISATLVFVPGLNIGLQLAEYFESVVGIGFCRNQHQTIVDGTMKAIISNGSATT